MSLKDLQEMFDAANEARKLYPDGHPGRRRMLALMLTLDEMQADLQRT